MDRTIEDGGTSGEEASYVAPVPATGSHAGYVLVLASAPPHEALFALLERACARLPRLRRRRVERRGGRGVAWLRDPDFELEFHLRWERLAADAELVPLATRRFFQPLARHRSPWEVHVLEGPGRTLVLVKLDRALEREGDAARLLDLLLGAESGTEKEPPLAPEQDPAAAAVEVLQGFQRRALAWRETAVTLAGTARQAAGLSRALAESALGVREGRKSDWPNDLGAAALRTARSLGALLTERLAERTPRPLPTASGGARGMTLLDLPVAALEAVRVPLGLRMESMLLAITAGAMSRMAGARGAEAGAAAAKSTIRALISLPGAWEAALLLPFGAGGLLERARSLDEILGALGGGARLAAMKQLSGAMAALPRALAQGLSGVSPPAHDVEVAYRAGACEGSLAGTPVRRVYPLAAGRKASPLVVAALHGERSLALGLVWDRASVKRPADLVAAWQGAWHDLVDSALAASTSHTRADSPARRPAHG